MSFTNGKPSKLCIVSDSDRDKYKIDTLVPVYNRSNGKHIFNYRVTEVHKLDDNRLQIYGVAEAIYKS